MEYTGIHGAIHTKGATVKTARITDAALRRAPPTKPLTPLGDCLYVQRSGESMTFLIRKRVAGRWHVRTLGKWPTILPLFQGSR